MNSAFLYKVQACADYLSNAKLDERENPTFTKNVAYREWLKAAYHEPEFLYDGDYFAQHEHCAAKDAANLNMEEVRASITFLLRQMRCEYAPYSCIVSGRLASLLTRYIALMKEETK